MRGKDTTSSEDAHLLGALARPALVVAAVVGKEPGAVVAAAGGPGARGGAGGAGPALRLGPAARGGRLCQVLGAAAGALLVHTWGGGGGLGFQGLRVLAEPPPLNPKTASCKV